MFCAWVILIGFGLLMLYSASWQYSVTVMGMNASYMLVRQLRFLLIGGIGAILAFYFDYHRIKKFVVPMMLVTLVMLLLVIFYVKEVRLGSKRVCYPAPSNRQSWPNW
jgi:cell division protein FtsW